MLELKYYEQLALFASCGTLSAAAEALHTSQPALSRSMKQMEEELGVTLFVRSKNKLELSPTGQKAAEYADQLIRFATDTQERIRAYDRSLHTLSVGFCAPIPQNVMTPIISTTFSGMTISFDMCDDTPFPERLLNGQYQLAVMHYAPKDDRFYCKKCGHEDLFVAVYPQHPLAEKKVLSFTDLDGLSVLLLHDIGFWMNMHQFRTPQTRYLHQHDRATFNDIAIHSPYPIFTSSYSLSRGQGPDGRVAIPIEDQEAHTDFYLVCLASEKQKYNDLFARVNERTIL
ncbi:MAG: LysR family transcriptional regulator [Firmicutes bacterium]|nr:LysR family transcriptional regulator [Bacillota bacterium]